MLSIKNLNCIMLVDDDIIYNLLHKKLINKAGYQNHIEVALNGKMALDYLCDSSKYADDKDHQTPELILLDINMPVMDGWEFLDAFSKLDKNITRNINIVMVTSSQNPDDLSKAKKIEILNDFASKPLTIHKINHISETCSIKVD